MTRTTRVVRGDIWMVDFGSDPEHPEQAFNRPAVIVSDDHLHHPKLGITIVVPGTSTIRSLPLHLVVQPTDHNGLSVETAFQVEQLRAVSIRRLTLRLGNLGPTEMESLETITRRTLRL